MNTAWPNNLLGLVISSFCPIQSPFLCFGLPTKSTLFSQEPSYTRQTVKEDKSLVYDDWKECIVPILESASAGLDPSYFGHEQYLAARSLIASRSFDIDDRHGFGMVPLADLFNHKTGAEDVHFTSTSSHSEYGDGSYDDMKDHSGSNGYSDPLNQNFGSLKSHSGGNDICSSPVLDNSTVLEMIIVKDVKAGAEVFNTYGLMGNAALLHRYGFTEPDNPYDIVNIDLELVLQWSSSLFSNRYRRTRLSLWRRLGYSTCVSQNSEYFEISFDGEPQIELLILLYLILVPEEVYHELYEASAARDFDISTTATLFKKETIVLREVSEASKTLLLTKSVRSSLLSLADIRESCYGSRSLEDDIEALKSCCRIRQKKLYHSLMLRISERRILEKLRTYVSAGGRSLRLRERATPIKKLQ